MSDLALYFSAIRDADLVRQSLRSMQTEPEEERGGSLQVAYRAAARLTDTLQRLAAPEPIPVVDRPRNHKTDADLDRIALMDPDIRQGRIA